MYNLHFLGNESILNEYKVGFLCSRRIPSDIILKTYDWAIAQRDKGICVVSGFHSKIEKDVFHYLLKGEQSMILVLARSIYKKIPEILDKEIIKGRLLIISPFRSNDKRASMNLCIKRNKYIVDLSNELFIPFVAVDGVLSRIIDYAKSQFKNITQL